MKKLLLILAIGLGFTSTSHASFLIEPYLGYEMAQGDQDGGNPDFKTELVNLGARIGWKSPVMLWLALDANIGVSGKFKPDSGADQDAKKNTYYGVVGLDLPILLRAWVGYGFSNELKLDDYSKKGTNMKFGVGFTGLPFVSINLEYMKDKYTENDGGGMTDFDTNASSYMLSLSLPLEF